jgi:hypothetical protein
VLSVLLLSMASVTLAKWLLEEKKTACVVYFLFASIKEAFTARSGKPATLFCIRTPFVGQQRCN